MTSGWSTPLSSSTAFSSPILKAVDSQQDVPFEGHRHAASIIEFIAFKQGRSSAVYVYDVAEHIGFGKQTKAWAKASNNSSQVVNLQSRPGAGLSLVGRLSNSTAATSNILTAYTTPSGLAQMAPSLVFLPQPSPTGRLIIQVPALSRVDESLTLFPTLSPLSSMWSIFPDTIAVILSSTPQQAVDFANIAYEVNTHIIHIFDHDACREIGPSITRLHISKNPMLTLHEAFKETGYDFFEYHGSKAASIIVVLQNGPLALLLKQNIGNSAIGMVIVNVVRPWDAAALQSFIPSSVEDVHVVEDVLDTVAQGVLQLDVFSALFGNSSHYRFHSHRLFPLQTLEFLRHRGSFFKFVSNITGAQLQGPTPSRSRKLLIFGTPLSPLSALPRFLEQFFALIGGHQVRLLEDHDFLSKPGGVTAARLIISGDGVEFVPIDSVLPIDATGEGHADFLAVLDQNLLKTHALLQHAKKSSAILVVSSWTAEEFLSNLPPSVLTFIHERNISVFLFDAHSNAKTIVGQGAGREAIQILLTNLAVLRLYLGKFATEENVLQLARISFMDTVDGISLEQYSALSWSGLCYVKIPAVDILVTTPPPLKIFEPSAFGFETTEGGFILNEARLSSWHDAAKHLIFPSVFSPKMSDGYATQNRLLRPEIEDQTYLVTCTVNKRLTPIEYDRNVFHLEFDTSGTGLKYAIGEALGIHGWNNEEEVLHFCNWYGVDPNRLVTIPLPGDDTQQMHTRTVFQALQQQIDVFGKPPKSFYADLAEYATTQADRYALWFIGSPEGSATFKNLSEKLTVTFSDVLKMYPSARPGIERLCEMIGDIKPRHYSIASSQSVVGDRVDLLVVTVDWVTPSGITRYGQCTRYLAEMKVGQKVTVSVKPSVMKLPPDPKQPLIMAGLGTGAAPFRAFLQHLAWLSSRGEEIGPVYYYFGSRFQKAEYLYGEEIEAFILDGVITRAGLAFSRDGPKKVYIQHKMLEDSEDLAKMLYDDKGVFYLCGPTWPVPDVYQALVNALVKYKNTSPVQAGEYIENLKEEERYVLEVY